MCRVNGAPWCATYITSGTLRTVCLKCYALHTRNTLLPRQRSRHFADNIFDFIFLSQNVAFLFKFYWSLFLLLRLKISHHWFSLPKCHLHLDYGDIREYVVSQPWPKMRNQNFYCWKMPLCCPRVKNRVIINIRSRDLIVLHLAIILVSHHGMCH